MTPLFKNYQKLMKMMEENEEKRSKFSSGLNIIYRLDLLWKNCSEFKRNGKFARWNNELDTIWLELARDLSKEEYNDKIEEEKIKEEGYKSQFDEFDKKLKESLPFLDSGTGFSKISNEDIKKRNDQYKTLMEKQLFLARLENHLNKGTSWNESEDDFD